MTYSPTLLDVLQTARSRFGALASVRLVAIETAQGISVVASACRSINTGSGAEEVGCVIAATPEAALAELSTKLSGRGTSGH